LKIVHIIIGLNRGGAETSLKKLVLNSQYSVDDVTIISLTDRGVIGNELARQGFSVKFLGLNSSFSLLTVFFKLLKILIKVKPDVVQTWMYHSDLIGGLAAKLIGCKKIFWGIRCTNIPIGSRTSFYVMKMCSYLSYFIPSKIICVAESARKTHIDFGYNPAKMLVVPNGVDLKVFEAKSSIRTVAHKSIVVGCLGRFHKDKGQDILLDAANKLLIDGFDIHFAFAGNGCLENNEEFISLIDDRFSKKCFSFFGEIDDAPRFLNTLDVFCMPSRTEGFPNCLAEAMAIGLPCIANNVGDVAALGSNVIKINHSNDSKGLYVCLADMILMTTLERRRFGKVAQLRIKNSFSLKKTVSRFDEIYKI
jgi:glycosyltransferase involved in cell wall biosynthesis